LTCAQLIQNGPGPQRYVTLLDARLSDGKSVSERDGATVALEMYHPIFEARLAQEPAPRDIGLILCIMDEMERRRIRDDRNERLRLGQAGLSELTGEVQPAAQHLPDWARRRLAQQFPGLPLDACRLVIVGQYEPTAYRASRLLKHGAVALLGASVLLALWWNRRRFCPNAHIASSVTEAAT
jgi:hypothetical protein